VTRLRRFRSLAATVVKGLIGLVAILLLVVVAAMAAAETGWAKDAIRGLIIRQANQYLTARLNIGRLEGSLFRGFELGDITLDRDGRTLVKIGEVALSYSVRELFSQGVTIRRVRLTRPYVAARKMPDGRWDLGALVRRESREQERTGPGRPIRIQSIEVIDGRISLGDPLAFGAARIPTDYQSLNAAFSFTYVPVRWTLQFDRVSWIGHAPDLSVNPLSGTFGRGPNGWFFEALSVTTARSAFTLDGVVDNTAKPTMLDLRVRAPKFAFQEWSGVLRGLTNIAVESSFDTSLKGPVNALETDLRLAGTGGAVHGHLTLDTSVPGWHGTGAVDVERLNLARWLNREQRASDITGHVTFNLALELGRRFPRGMYTFAGPHAMYMGYAADAVKARGQITATSVLIAEADATAYGAKVTTRDGSIGIDAPFPFHFEGTTARIDLRRLPAAIPVPHVESLLTFDYDVDGRFNNPFITGRALFAESEFLGATVGAGTVGSIDTLQQPLRYSGEGDVSSIELRRFGEGLDVAWLRDPRYAGTLSGHFRVDASGTSAATLTLTGGGRLTTAEIFKGALSDADVSVDINGGTLKATYDGRLDRIDPSVPFDDPRLAASLTGTGKLQATVRELLTRTTPMAIEDYDVTGTLTLQQSTVREIALDSARVTATLRDATLTIAELQATSQTLEGRVEGRLGLAGESVTSDLQYEIVRGDLAKIGALAGYEIAGTVSTKGRVTGPYTALHAVGDATVNQLQGFGVSALAFTTQYDVTIPSGDAVRATARLSGRGEFLTLAGQSLQMASGTVTYDAKRLGFDLRLAQTATRNGQIAGAVLLDIDKRESTILELSLTLGRAPWRLANTTAPPVVSWSDKGIAVTTAEFVDNNNDERIVVGGTWRQDGSGALRITATHVFLDTLQAAFETPTRYGGVLDLDATISGTRGEPRVTGNVTISNGRVQRVSYQKLAGRFTYTGRRIDLDFRLDQGPGTWITAVGNVPLSLFNPELIDEPIDVEIKSSTISLGLVEGLTSVVREVGGELTIDVRAVGTSRDPHFAGRVEIQNATFLAVASGAQYKNVRASLALAADKISVQSLHVEDVDGDPMDVQGSLGTHELHVGDLEIQVTARRFEVMRNAYGRVDVDAAVEVRGRAEAPRIAGLVTINSGSLRVDEILARALFQPYATEETAMTDLDPVAALNPWDRLGLDLFLRVPGTLRMVGDNVQISPGTPIGLGNINLRLTGDLYLYKDPGEPISVTGSFDSITGTYAFQGRRFDVFEESSINFRGDLNPEIYVTVTRVISGVETRVSIFGPMKEPELRLSSVPPLDQSDILSLILFNTSTNQLSAAQQEELVVRAGTLAAGFLATPILAAIESEIGLDIFEIAPGEFGTGPKVTIGEEVAPGLVARFSRQFGSEAYDEATIEYYLSRLFRLRATFSDAQSLSARSPFRRVERAGIDFLLFFSF
jgi:autotransporter translocation and assembly factor TamB